MGDVGVNWINCVIVGWWLVVGWVGYDYMGASCNSSDDISLLVY